MMVLRAQAVVLVRVSLRVRPAMGVNTASQKKTRQKGLQSNCFPMLSMLWLEFIDISCEQSKMVEKREEATVLFY